MAELDLERIARAALHVVDTEGAAGFTMRAVAEQLGVTPMALYHHVEDKAALVALVLDASLSELPLPELTGDWRNDLFRQARWSRACALEHPNASQLYRMHQTWTPAMLPLTERWTNLWQQSGLTRSKAVRAAWTSSLAVNGYVDTELRLRSLPPPDEQLLADAPNARKTLATRSGGDADFELAVRALVDGIHAQLAAPGRTVSPRTTHARTRATASRRPT